LNIAPGLEGGALQVVFQASDAAELNTLAGKLLEAAQKDALAEIFRLLHGEAPNERQTGD
jgi:hypothetical protein